MRQTIQTIKRVGGVAVAIITGYTMKLTLKPANISRFALVVFIGVLTFTQMHTPKTAADTSTCTADSSPRSIEPSSTQDVYINIKNTDSEPITWIKIDRPPSDYNSYSVGTSGWDTSNAGDYVVLYNGSLQPNDALSVDLSVGAPNYEIDPNNWIVTALINNNPVVCTGTLDLATVGAVQTGLTISNLRLTNLTTNSATISWDTNTAATSKINYGLDSSYGSSTNLDTNMATSHSQTISGLSANTAYHYQVVSTDSQSNTATSNDSTFLTATQTPGTSSNNQPPSINIVITNPSDKAPPTISLTGTLPHIVKQIPAISGVAKDDQAVMAVQYSTDNGQNWLPVDSAPTLGAKQVPFSFTPINLDDGNYIIIVKAIDAGGNTASTTPTTVVVDRLPPLVGGALVSLGPQILTPDSNNVITTLAGIDQKITMSAVGGPTTIAINATQVGGKTTKVQSFNLTQDINSGLWSGILSFRQAGVYSLVANSIDGAGNKTSHQLNTINVSSAARVVGQGTNKALKAELKLYSYDSDTNSWIPWDGSPFGQTNPQTTGTNGSFKLFLPSGKYYLTVTAGGYKPLVSNIFTLQETTPLTTQLNMDKVSGLKLGPVLLSLPNFSSQAININPTVPKIAQSVNPNKLMNKSFPDVTLPSTDGSKVNSISWLGRPTLLSFMVSWLPSTSEQLKPLSELQTNKDINIVPIALQENSDKMRVYTQTAGYSLNWLVDPDSTLTNVVNIQSLPTHYFINRDGVVKKVITGILSKQQILDYLSAL